MGQTKGHLKYRLQEISDTCVPRETSLVTSKTASYVSLRRPPQHQSMVWDGLAPNQPLVYLFAGKTKQEHETNTGCARDEK